MTKVELIEKMVAEGNISKEIASKALESFAKVADTELKKKGVLYKKKKSMWRSSIEFVGLAIQKLIENLLSIKVWIIFVYMVLSFIMVKGDMMTGDIFATSNGSVISIVIALREAFKTQKIRAIANGASEESKEKIKNIAL